VTFAQWSDYLWSYARWLFLLLVPTVAWLVLRSLDKEARLRRVEAAYKRSLTVVADLVTKEGVRDVKRDDARDEARDEGRDDIRDEARDLARDGPRDSARDEAESQGDGV
jgi:flagellar biosynthesis/type III secretory pathway M-ring protein FliF/YscJ